MSAHPCKPRHASGPHRERPQPGPPPMAAGDTTQRSQVCSGGGWLRTKSQPTKQASSKNAPRRGCQRTRPGRWPLPPNTRSPTAPGWPQSGPERPPATGHNQERNRAGMRRREWAGGGGVAAARRLQSAGSACRLHARPSWGGRRQRGCARASGAACPHPAAVGDDGAAGLRAPPRPLPALARCIDLRRCTGGGPAAAAPCGPPSQGASSRRAGRRS